MTQQIHVQRTPALDLAAIEPLVTQSEAEGYAFVARLRKDYLDGTNRFAGVGEALFIAAGAMGIVGIAGLNRDPYLADPTVGRVRHLYVLREARGAGTGRALVEAIVTAARPCFRVLTLRTDNPVAARLYVSLGFEASPMYAQASHWREL